VPLTKHSAAPRTVTSPARIPPQPPLTPAQSFAVPTPLTPLRAASPAVAPLLPLHRLGRL
jgi:hypothetical protein